MSEVTVAFKSGLNANEWNYLHPEIHEMTQFLVMIFDAMGFDFQVTSMVRPKGNDSGIHATGRALDGVPRETPNSKYKMSMDQFQKIAAFMNFIFRRPATFRSCIYHDAGTGWHYHLQCDPTPGWVDLKGSIPVEAGPTEAPLPPPPSAA